MPLYDYVCAACGRRFEVIQGIHDEGPTTCPLCGDGPVRKAVTASAVHFKGSGWAKKERRSAARKSATDKPDAGEPAAASTSSESGEATAKDGGSTTTTPTAPSD